MPKVYYTQNRVGSAKYTVSFHDGVDTHRDGSPFYGIRLFSDKKAFAQFQKDLEKDGYSYDRP